MNHENRKKVVLAMLNAAPHVTNLEQYQLPTDDVMWTAKVSFPQSSELLFPAEETRNGERLILAGTYALTLYLTEESGAMVVPSDRCATLYLEKYNPETHGFPAKGSEKIQSSFEYMQAALFLLLLNKTN